MNQSTTNPFRYTTCNLDSYSFRMGDSKFPSSLFSCTGSYCTIKPSGQLMKHGRPKSHFNHFSSYRICQNSLKWNQSFCRGQILLHVVFEKYWFRNGCSQIPTVLVPKLFHERWGKYGILSLFMTWKSAHNFNDSFITHLYRGLFHIRFPESFWTNNFTLSRRRKLPFLATGE